MELGDTALWTRVNALEPRRGCSTTSPQTRRRDRRPLEVIMIPKVEGPWDIHYVDRLLAQLEAKAGLQRPILVHAILETSPRSRQPRGDRRRQPAHPGDELRPGRPGGLAAHEDDARGRRAPRLPHDRRPRPREPGGAAPQLPAGPLALLDRAHGRRLHGRRRAALLRPLRRHPRRARAAKRSSAPPSCSAASAPGRCTRPRSRSPSASSRRTPRRCASPRR